MTSYFLTPLCLCALLMIQGCALFDVNSARNNRENAATAGTHLHSPELAFSITVQQPWQIQVKDSRLLARHHDAAKQLSSPAPSGGPSAPLLIASVPDGKTQIPPTIQVNYRKNTVAGTTDPVALLEQQLFYLRAAYQQFTYLSAPEVVHTSAHEAACAQFTAQSGIEIDGEGREEQVTMKFCLIPRGDVMFMIAMAADSQLFPRYQPSFDAMLASVRL